MGQVLLDSPRTLRRDKRTDCCTFTLHDHHLLVSYLEPTLFHVIVSESCLGYIWEASFGFMDLFFFSSLFFFHFLQSPYTLLRIDTTVWEEQNNLTLGNGVGMGYFLLQSHDYGWES